MSYTNNISANIRSMIEVVFIKLVLDLNCSRLSSLMHKFLVWITIIDKIMAPITTNIFTPFSLVRVLAATPRKLSTAGEDIFAKVVK